MARTWGRRLAKIAGYGILVLLVLAALAITFTVGWRPVIGAKKRPLTARKFESTPERMRRGEYLVHAVMLCMGCHSKYDEKANPPVLLSKEGAGAVLFEEGDFRIVAPNITSDPETGIGKWSDDAIARAIREGIAADGSVLFPVDALRTLPPHVRRRRGFHRGLPPQPAAGAQRTASGKNSVPIRPPHPGGTATGDRACAGAGHVHPRQARRIPGQDGTCTDCHTPLNPKFQPIPGMEMAGGNPMGKWRVLAIR